MPRYWTQADFLEFRDKLARSSGLTIEELESLPPVSPPPPQCSSCGDLGYVKYDVPTHHSLFGKLHPCPNDECPTAAARRSEAAARRLTRSGIPAKYAAFTFDTFYSQPAELLHGKQIAAAACWCMCDGRLFSLEGAASLASLKGAYPTEGRGWIVLSGPMGLGKTGLAAAVVNERASRGADSVFYRLADLFADIQGRYGRGADGGPSADDLLDDVKRSALLVLDECNVPKPSEDKARIVEEIIRHRHGRDLPTLITTNLNPNEFATMWGGRTADVVLENAHWLNMTGPRLRRSASVTAGE